MPHLRGKTRDLTFSYQRIDRAISDLNGECFTPKEIHKITGVNRGNINTFLLTKTKNGLLERVKLGCYRKISSGDLTESLPMSFIATKVWEILYQSDKPLTLREISQIIAENTGLNLYFQISNLFIRWCNRNVLDKFVGKRPYAYKIKPIYKDQDRISASSRFDSDKLRGSG